jgi:hypothetical protein
MDWMMFIVVISLCTCWRLIVHQAPASVIRYVRGKLYMWAIGHSFQVTAQISSARMRVRAGTSYNGGEQCENVLILEGAVRWLGRIGDWWRRERLFTLVLRAMEAGVGVREVTWAQATPAETVLAWFDAQIASARRPYGAFGVKLVVVCSDQITPSIELLISRSKPWWPHGRELMARELAPMLDTSAITTGVIAASTAMSAVLDAAAADR